jgi:peptidyl-prolyl cis-trans isomerase D
MKKNTKKYKSDNTRNIDYVLIENKPSKEDENEMVSKIDNLLYGKIVYNKDLQKNDTLPSFKEVKDK